MFSKEYQEDCRQKSKEKTKIESTPIAHFQKNANFLSKLISDLDIILPHQRNYENVNWYLYTIATSKRDQILKKLNAKGIGAASYYPTPVHKTPFYLKKLKLPVTDWASSHVLSLPIHPKVTAKNIEFIAKTLRDILNE